jgi:hypothetical protein
LSGVLSGVLSSVMSGVMSGAVSEAASQVPEPEPRWRAGLRAAGTAAAFALIWCALVVPAQPSQLSPLSLLRLPAEGLVVAALVLVLPPRFARITVVVAGALLALVAILKIADAGFYTALDRPASVITDGPLLRSGLDFIAAAYSGPAAVAAAIGVVSAVIAVGALLVFSVRRVSTILRRHRGISARAVAGLSVAWVILALLGAHLSPGQPIAAAASASVAYQQVARARADLKEGSVFAEQLRSDAGSGVPDDQVLTGLRGKNIVLAFVESYGRTALEDPAISPGIQQVLAQGTRQLGAQGWTARTGFLTSPTAGGGSWLAHSTLLSGTWVDNSSRYNDLLASRRTTLIKDFNRAGWKTVAVMPGTRRAWPQGSFYGFSRIDIAPDLGYAGPKFGWSPMPDQFVFDRMHALNFAAAQAKPVMVEVEMTSSHTPWAPLPTPVTWNEIGDGSVYGPIAAQGLTRDEVWRHQKDIRTQYGLSVQYSLKTLISYLQRYGDENTVLIFLGDHQPAPVITGSGASRDIPITIVAKDPAVLTQISSWGWQGGLAPQPNAPVWPMASFRERFLTAFSSGTP